MAIKKGDKIKVDYTGTLDDGTIFDSSKHGDHSHPLEFEVGSGMIIKGFDDAVMGMTVGEEKKFKLKPEQAYGEYMPNLVQKIPRSSVPKDHEPKAGMFIELMSPEGHRMPAKIAEVTDEIITLDLNHPMAGKTLNFAIKIVEIC